MSSRIAWGRGVGPAVVLVGALALGACTIADERMAGAFVDPAAHRYDSCPLLASNRVTVSKRMNELRDIMARGEADPVGGMVNSVTYRSEYLNMVGRLRQIDANMADKKCPAAPAGATPDPTAAATSIPPEQNPMLVPTPPRSR